MQLEIDNADLQKALQVILRLATPVSGAITLESTGKKLFIRSTSDVSRCSINLPATVTGKPNKFNVNVNALKDATKGRQQLSIDYSKTMCRIKSKSFLMELATEDAMEMEYDKEEKIATMQIDGDQAGWLKSSLTVVNLKPTPLLSPFMPVAVRLTKKGAFVCCYDDNHMAYVKTKEIKGDMELMVPIELLQSVLESFQGGAFTLSLSKANVYVENDLMSVVISRPEEQDNALTTQEIMEGAAGTKGDGASIGVDKVKLAQFLDNVRGIAGKERAEIKLEVEDGKMTLMVTTASGSAKTKIPVETNKKKVSAIIDYEYMDEAVRKSGTTTMIKIVSDEFAAFDLKTGTVVVSLNQDQG